MTRSKRTIDEYFGPVKRRRLVDKDDWDLDVFGITHEAPLSETTGAQTPLPTDDIEAPWWKEQDVIDEQFWPDTTNVQPAVDKDEWDLGAFDATSQALLSETNARAPLPADGIDTPWWEKQDMSDDPFWPDSNATTIEQPAVVDKDERDLGEMGTTSQALLSETSTTPTPLAADGTETPSSSTEQATPAEFIKSTLPQGWSFNLQALEPTMTQGLLLTNFHVSIHECDASTVVNFTHKTRPAIDNFTKAMDWRSKLLPIQVYNLGVYAGDGIHSTRDPALTGLAFVVTAAPAIIDLLVKCQITKFSIRFNKGDVDVHGFVRTGAVAWECMDADYQALLMKIGLPSSKLFDCVPDKLDTWWLLLVKEMSFEVAKVFFAVFLVGFLYTDGTVLIKACASPEEPCGTIHYVGWTQKDEPFLRWIQRRLTDLWGVNAAFVPAEEHGAPDLRILNLPDVQRIFKRALERLASDGVAFHGKIELLWRIIQHPRISEAYLSPKSWGRQSLKQSLEKVDTHGDLATRAIARVISRDFHEIDFGSARAFLRLLGHQDDITSVWQLDIAKMAEFLKNASTGLAGAYARTVQMRIVDATCSQLPPDVYSKDAYVRCRHCDKTIVRNKMSDHKCTGHALRENDVVALKMSINKHDANYIHPPFKATLNTSIFTCTQSDEDHVTCDACKQSVTNRQWGPHVRAHLALFVTDLPGMCSTCHVFCGQHKLQVHNEGKLHKKRLTLTRQFDCHPCGGVPFASKNDLKVHQDTKYHKINEKVQAFVIEKQKEFKDDE
ncbi:hypothetical protein BC940DRAFT_5059 [Gongronella butleri]|nr:hypothetical protein BC940DRAFT_5059 [Gongronella butleri]